MHASPLEFSCPGRVTLPGMSPGLAVFAQGVDRLASAGHPEEIEVTASFAPKRAAEFHAGRAALRAALGEIGAPVDGPLLREASGAPITPAGTVGAISHTHGIAVAAAASRTRYLSVSVDIERAQRTTTMTDSMLARIFSEKERAQPGFGPELGLVLFSAKETIHKLLNPVTGRFYGSDDVECFFAESDGTIEASIRAALVPQGMTKGIRVMFASATFNSSAPYVLTFAYLAA